MADAFEKFAFGYSAPQDVLLKDATVNLADVDSKLQSFLINAGFVHGHLFGQSLIVTSGKDGQHTAGSKHAQGKAVDLRISDLRPEWHAAFILAMRVLCDRFGCCIFDESNLPGAGHVHIEIAG